MKLTTKMVTAILAATLATGVYAKGGTAKPPVKGALGPFNVPTLPDPVLAPGTTLSGFDDTGFLQNATVSSAGCPNLDPSLWGGTATINGKTITIPCNMIIQMPANTFTWADMVNGGPSLSLNGGAYPGYELNVVGNIVNGKHIAGLMYISQESLNSGNGIISRIDYSTGNIEVDTGNPGSPVVLQINDPGHDTGLPPPFNKDGRFGRAQSPDPRFSVDDENPTIHAATGYPMCVPRTNPAVADDPLCPQKNRPKANLGCRNFSQAGVAPPVSGELGLPTGTYCTQFVMKAVPGTTAKPPFFSPSATNIATATDPDVRQQAPLEVGDFISFSGTLLPNGIISTHTIEANVGIYTQPGTQPSYLVIGEFGVGTADPLATSINGVPQETQDRIFLEAETTDVKVPVDIYMVDVGPDGVEHNRWATMFEMTGECNPASLTTACLGVDGGITTQNTGPQPQRARIRATKSITGILSQPSRNIRVAARSLCKPTHADLDVNTGHSASLDACLSAAPLAANGLMVGQYSAPVFEYIFPEGVRPGDLVVPNDFWHLPFLRFGDADVGPLTPTPW